MKMVEHDLKTSIILKTNFDRYTVNYVYRLITGADAIDLNIYFESLAPLFIHKIRSRYIDHVGQNAHATLICRDSFITKQDKYRWARPFLLYREDTRPMHNTTASYKLYETVPDYFSGAVLQRYHLNESDNGAVTLKFQMAFHLAILWMIVFVSLSKGEFIS